jgi:ABC-type sugar transport system ATPase subunit
MLMVKVEYANQVVREFIAEHGMALLPHKIIQVCAEYDYTVQKMTSKDRIFAGLRYSEFLTNENTNQAYWHASDFSQKLCEKHGIDFTWLMEEMREMGWH